MRTSHSKVDQMKLRTFFTHALTVAAFTVQTFAATGAATVLSWTGTKTNLNDNSSKQFRIGMEISPEMDAFIAAGSHYLACNTNWNEFTQDDVKMYFNYMDHENFVRIDFGRGEVKRKIEKADRVEIHWFHGDGEMKFSSLLEVNSLHPIAQLVPPVAQLMQRPYDHFVLASDWKKPNAYRFNLDSVGPLKLSCVIKSGAE
jgi:hypothetical protein